MELLTSESRLVMIASLVHPKDLYCIEASVDVLEKRHSSAKSIFHYRILKCRQLIFSDPQIIAAPVLEIETQIYIVMSRKYFESGEINALLKKMKLSRGDPVGVSNDIFEKCLLYTITTKVSPQWNQVKGYLVYGRRFLTSTEALPAVKLQIVVNESKANMVVWTLRLMLENTKLEDLGIPLKVNQDFMMHFISTIPESNIETQWIHVLPAFTKGQILQITHHIPEICPYKTYKEMKRHWKNMYGYRLPEEEEEEIIYYTISNINNDASHVIPSSCIRTHDVILLNHMNPLRILEWFHDILLRKVPEICGLNIFLSKNLAYAFPKEGDLSLDMYFNFSLISKMNDVIESEPVVLFPCTNSVPEEKINKTETTDLKDQRTLQDKTNCDQSSLQDKTNCDQSSLQDKTNCDQSTLQDKTNCDQSTLQDKTNCDQRTLQDKTNCEISLSQNVSNCDKKLILDKEEIEKSTETLPQQNPVVSCDTTKPISVIIRKPLQDIPQVLNLKKFENWPGSVKKTDIDAKSLSLPTIKSVYSENCHNDTRFIQATLSRIALSAQKIEAVVSSSGTQGLHNFYTFPAQKLLMEQTRVSSQACLTFKDMMSSGSQQVNIISNTDQSFMPEKERNLKRDASLLGENDILDLVKKKPRSRPQVQLDVDVELVARNYDLQRVNKITLVYWLRNKLVPCKVKDKKSDLVIKVMEYLNLPVEKPQL